MLESNITCHFTLVRFSVHIDVKFPSIVSELDSFLLLAKIKGKGALALLAAPSYVHVPSPLQVKWFVPKS
jgi:hypothetical protein